MSESEENRFDSILLALAEQHKNGVPEVIFCYSESMFATPIHLNFSNHSATGHAGWFHGPKN